MTDADSGGAEPADTAEPEATPLLAPADGVPSVSVTPYEIKQAADLLASGHGSFAVDAERASGFRYSNRAYLVQIRRDGAGTVLIDPVYHGALQHVGGGQEGIQGRILSNFEGGARRE